jgi:hypothetical protein
MSKCNTWNNNLFYVYENKIQKLTCLEMLVNCDTVYILVALTNLVDELYTRANNL